MKVRWQTWMIWIDRKTGKLRPSAPPKVVERYNKYMEERLRYKNPDLFK